jgi:DNA-binding PadR family transcriptional regulator
LWQLSGWVAANWSRDRCIDHRYIGMVREPTFLILTALAGPSLHGYGVMRAVDELSERRVRLSAGTLYAAFDRLVLEGLITIDREETVSGRVRRYYTLTPAGGTALRDESAMLRRNADLAAERLARWSVLRPRPS